MEFEKITAELLAADEALSKYFLGSQLRPGKNGGSFVGNYDIAPEEFRRYGIVLSKGGMILPHMELAELKSEVGKRRYALEEKKKKELEVVLAERDEEEKEYLKEVSRLIKGYGLHELKIVRCKKTGGGLFTGPLKEQTVLAYGEDAAFLLKEEHNPRTLESYIRRASLEDVEKFLIAETRVYPARQQFLARIKTAVARNSELNKMRTDKEAYANKINSIAYGGHYEGEIHFYPLQPGIESAHALLFKEKRLFFHEEGIKEIEEGISSAEKMQKDRLQRLWKLFVKVNGVLTFTTHEESCFAGHSMATGKAKWDEWTEYRYYVDGVAITDVEKNWLKKDFAHFVRFGEFLPSEGYYRSPNHINEIKPLIFPHEDDLLEVWGQTGNSRRGVKPMGFLYQGRPEDCRMSTEYRWVKKNRWTLNGQEIWPCDKDFSTWNSPEERAKRAFEQAGIETTKEEIEALAEAYRQIDAKKPPKVVEPEKKEVVSASPPPPPTPPKQEPEIDPDAPLISRRKRSVSAPEPVFKEETPVESALAEALRKAGLKS